MAFTGSFARGLVNGSFVVLALWGIFYLVTAKKAFWRPTRPLPAKYFYGLLLYFTAIIISILAGSEYARGFKHLANVAYLLLPLPLTWLALSQWPSLIRWLVPLYGAGLLVAGTTLFAQAGLTISCVRAKAFLGYIELGAVLPQLTPLMVGALALAIKDLDRKKIVFYVFVLFAAYVAHIVNCSRIAILSAPVLSALVLWAHRDCFGRVLKISIVAVILLGVALVLSNERVVSRFKEIGQGDVANYNNQVRFSHWKKGFEVFKENPILGVGPRAIPNSPPVPNPLFPQYAERERPKYYHAHQVFLTVLAESGLVGLIGFLALHLAPIVILWPYRKSRDKVRRFWVYGAFVMALQLFFNGLTDAVFTLKPLMYIYWTVTGTALWAVSQSSSAEKGESA
jgi:O-antigen ligase